MQPTNIVCTNVPRNWKLLENVNAVNHSRGIQINNQVHLLSVLMPTLIIYNPYITVGISTYLLRYDWLLDKQKVVTIMQIVP